MAPIPCHEDAEKAGCLDEYVSVTSPRRQIKIPLRRVWRYSYTDFDSIANLLDDTDWDVLQTMISTPAGSDGKIAL